MEITRELFEQQRRPRFGSANPERMQFAFWEWMIRGDGLQPSPGSGLAAAGLIMREGVLKSSYGPYRARDLFNVPSNREDGPIWTFDRMGRTRSELPDERVVCIGGEHEDFYDPDFCIYNDVVVFKADGETEIYGYPTDVFPPTDFHTATLIDQRIILIGGLGYKNARILGHTPVYALDISDFHIDEIQTAGEMPGWIFEHQAEIDDAGIITIGGGQIVQERDAKQKFLCNLDDYTLNLKSGIWCKITHRQQRQFEIRRDDKLPFALRPLAKAEVLLPHTIEHSVVRCESRSAQIVVEGTDVSLEVGISEIQIIVQGLLSEEILVRLCEDIRINAQSIFQCRCSLKGL